MELKQAGIDFNVFRYKDWNMFVVDAISNALKRKDYSDDFINEFRAEALKGNFINLIHTCLQIMKSY